MGIGAVRTGTDATADVRESETQAGWTIGGGLLLFLSKHVGLKGDVRHYHSFGTLDLLGLDLARDSNKIDFDRATFGVRPEF